MGDKSVLSDILLFKQLDEDFRRDGNHIANGDGELKRGGQQVEGRKKLVVVKKAQQLEPSQLPEINAAAQPTKKLIVARKVRLGDTSLSTLPPLAKSDSFPSDSSTAAQANGHHSISHAEQPFDHPDATVPLSIRGPKYDSENRVIERSVLGSVDDYLSYTKPVDVAKSTGNTLTKSGSIPDRPKTAADADELIDIMKNMSIHEKVRYLKEERALQRWERTVAEWERIKARMASKTGRDMDHVLLSRSENFREVMEQKELIERALATKDHEIIDLFATTLRNVGAAEKGLFIEMKRPSRDPMEVIGKPGASRSRPSSSYYSYP